MAADIDSIPLQHEYVTDAGFAHRSSLAYTAFVLRRPAYGVFYGLFAAIGIACIVGGGLTAAPTTVAIGVAYLLLVAAVAPIVYLKSKQGTRKRVPVGSRIAVGLGADAIRTQGPLGDSQTSYRAYSAVYRQGDFVILRMLGVRAYSFFPIELLPGDDFARLQAAVKQAAS